VSVIDEERERERGESENERTRTNDGNERTTTKNKMSRSLNTDPTSPHIHVSFPTQTGKHGEWENKEEKPERRATMRREGSDDTTGEPMRSTVTRGGLGLVEVRRESTTLPVH